MKIGVMGAGAIGCFVGGKLAAKGHDVLFVGRERFQRELNEHPLVIEELGRRAITVGKVAYSTDPAVLTDSDVVLVCVKSAATRETADVLSRVLRRDAIVVSLQNGVRNPAELREKLVSQRVLAGIVTFNVVAKGNGVFRQATTGPLVIEALDEPQSHALSRAIVEAGMELDRNAHMPELQWSKLLINLNNAVGALSDRPTKELIDRAEYRRILAALIREALVVLRAAGIRPAKLGRFPIDVLVAALRLPTALVRIVARAQLRIDPEARSSMWQDLNSRRETEVDWINGEIVKLAERHQLGAPLNRRIVELVHEAERQNGGSHALSAEELYRRLTV